MSDAPLIVLCDDAVENAEDWKRDLAVWVDGTFELEVVQKDQFERDVQALEDRRRALREDKEPAEGDTVFDRARILIVDYDLFEYKPEQLLTGDSIAYLARTYSECGYIVGVNQDRLGNPFDATLVGHRNASTDLSIGSDQVADPGLWSDDPSQWNAFRPWYWPVLPQRAAAIERLAEGLGGSLDLAVTDVLGLSSETLAALPRPVAGLLEVPGEADTASLPLRKWAAQSQMGIRPGDRVRQERQLARIAAARLAKWVESVLLPGQDVLVDAPHLTERRPGLLRGSSEDPASWNATPRVGVGPDEAGLDTQRLSRHAFDDRWTSRPVWRWDGIASDETFDEFRGAPRPDPPLVFAEDASRFVTADRGRRFTAGVEPPFRSRWLLVPDGGQQYLPASVVVGA